MNRSGSESRIRWRREGGVCARATVPETIVRGEDFIVEAFPVDEAGKPFRAVLPLEVIFTSGKTVTGEVLVR